MVKRKIIWSARAKLDLSEILDYYYRRNGTKIYSKKLNSNIRKSIRLLRKLSDIGIQTDVKDVRNLIFGDYNIFYRISIEIIEIITIWDSRQNPEKLNINK